MRRPPCRRRPRRIAAADARPDDAAAAADAADRRAAAGPVHRRRPLEEAEARHAEDNPEEFAGSDDDAEPLPTPVPTTPPPRLAAPAPVAPTRPPAAGAEPQQGPVVVTVMIPPDAQRGSYLTVQLTDGRASLLVPLRRCSGGRD